MRVDQYLKTCCLVKHRTEARKACDLGIVKINGTVAKASKEVRVGDVIAIHSENRQLEVEVLDVPAGQVARRHARELYRIRRDEHRQLLDF